MAALFAVHPLRVESVAWVTERKDVLSGFFYVLTLAAYVSYVHRRASWLRYLAVIVAFAMGLMAKPSLVALPFLLLLLDYWPLGRLGSTKPRSSIAPLWRDDHRSRLCAHRSRLCAYPRLARKAAAVGALGGFLGGNDVGAGKRLGHQRELRRELADRQCLRFLPLLSRPLFLSGEPVPRLCPLAQGLPAFGGDDRLPGSAGRHGPGLALETHPPLLPGWLAMVSWHDAAGDRIGPVRHPVGGRPLHVLYADRAGDCRGLGCRRRDKSAAA